MTICIVRTLIVYAAIMLSMRIMGKRQIAQLAPSELVVAVLISDLAANPLQDNGTPLLYGLLPILVLLCCEVLISAAINKSVKLRAIICGRPSMIICDGKLKISEMIKNRYTPDDLQEALRQQGICDIDTVLYAVLEVNGSLSVILKDEFAPITAHSFNDPDNTTAYPITVISEGRTLSANVKLLGRDENWVRQELNKRGIDSAEDVYLMCCDRNGKIYLAEWS